MRRARRLEGEHKSALVVAALDAAVERGRRPTISGIAREAGVGRKFIYDHPELRAQVELRAAQAADDKANDLRTAARVTGASLRADLENARAQNRRLQDRLRAAEGRLSQLQGTRVLSDESFPEAMLTELADQALAQRNAELEATVFELKEELRRTRGTRCGADHQSRTHATRQPARPRRFGEGALVWPDGRGRRACPRAGDERRNRLGALLQARDD